ncbi:MAG: glycosyltransferase family 39 protein [Chloroflexota bacterium]
MTDPDLDPSSDPPAAALTAAGAPVSGLAAADPRPDPGPRSGVLGLSDVAWTRLALLGILVLTAVIDLWNLSANGWANEYYAAAVQAGTQDWTAFFFGSFDSSNFITVDKPPASLWVMGLSARLFGLSSWSLLVPQALMGVAAVGVLFATVRRSFGAVAGLLAALILALTPVAAVMFRFNNPDALLTLLMVLGAWALGRGLPRGSLAWAALAAACIGTAFLAKSLEAYVVLPSFALVWLVCAGASLPRRIAGLVVAFVTVLVTSGWWVAIVELTPASARPYIGGSDTNSVVELIFGYNGFGRLLGGEGPGGGPGGGIGFGGTPGILRMFNATFGGQISWLLPMAVLAVPVGLWLYRRAGRTHPALAGYLLWGSWLVVSGLTFSFMSGIIHEYYTVALAPAVAALTAGVVVDLWRRRASRIASVVLAGGVAVTAWWSAQLLARTPEFLPGLGSAVLAAGLAAAAGLVLAAFLPRFAWRGPLRAVAAGLALGAILAGPVAYTAETMTSPANGSIVLAGPVNAFGGPAGIGRFVPTVPPGGAGPQGRTGPTSNDGVAGGPGAGPGRGPGGGRPGAGGPFGGTGSGGPGSGGPGGPGNGGPGGDPGGTGGPTGGTGAPGQGGPGRFEGTGSNGGGGSGFGGGFFPSGFPGFGGGVDEATLQYLVEHRGTARWIVAASGTQGAASMELTSGQPVMAMGGFSGTDPAPSLEQLQALIAKGDLRYVLVGGRGFGGFGPGGARNGISAWVQSACVAVTIAGSNAHNVYDCAGATTG